MQRALALLPLLLLSSLASAEDATAADSTEEWPHTVIVDGVEGQARWDDGDTFAMPGAMKNGKPGRWQRMRLAGYNTLESYGPVHRWGTWTAPELYALAKEAGEVAGSQAWSCSLTGGDGGYGRKTADCPELRQELLRRGLAHVFVVDTEANAEDLAIQQEAITNKVGMWAKGVPSALVTSLHSVDEKPDQTETYNRVANLQTGVAAENTHGETYTTCQEVCVGGTPSAEGGSCMVYVPYKQRYKNQPSCLTAD